MKIGTVEPKYNDLLNFKSLETRLWGGKKIQNDALAFIYGAIAKYAWRENFMKDEEYLNSLKEYIISKANEIGEKTNKSGK